MKTVIILALLLFTAPLSAERFFVATAYDTEGYESGYSNEVQFSGGVGDVTFEWSPNSEPDLAGYRLWSGKISGGPYVQAGNDIPCGGGNAPCCTITLSIEDPKNIQLQGDQL